MATIYDVAKHAGVSPKTVSRVLNREPNVREQTKDVVSKAIANLGYRPSTAARMMKSQRTNVIGFLTNRVVTSPESIDMARGVSEAAKAAGYTVLLVPDGDAKLPLSGPEKNVLVDLNVDGLIYASHSHRRIQVAERVTGPGRNKALPIVLANCFEDKGRYVSVLPDDYRGGYMAAEMLISQGHRDVVFMNLEDTALAAPLRAQGFIQAFAEAGLPAPKVISALSNDADIWYENQNLDTLLDKLLGQPRRPTALFCGNDKMAMLIYGFLAERGLKVPEDISIVGFDDYKLITRLLRPQLSSVGISYGDIGRRAFSELLSQIDEKSPKGEERQNQILIPGKPQIRGSIARLG